MTQPAGLAMDLYSFMSLVIFAAGTLISEFLDSQTKRLIQRSSLTLDDETILSRLHCVDFSACMWKWIVICCC